MHTCVLSSYIHTFSEPEHAAIGLLVGTCGTEYLPVHRPFHRPMSKHWQQFAVRSLTHCDGVSKRLDATAISVVLIIRTAIIKPFQTLLLRHKNVLEVQHLSDWGQAGNEGASATRRRAASVGKSGVVHAMPPEHTLS